MSFLRRFFGKFFIGLGAYAFIMFSLIYTAGLFFEEKTVSHKGALVWCFVTILLVMIGKLIHPKVIAQPKDSQIEGVQKGSFDFDILKLTFVGWGLLYSCIVIQALAVGIFMSLFPDVAKENTKLIGMVILCIVVAYAYFSNKILSKSGIRLLSD